MKKKYAALVLAAMLTLGGTGLANATVAVEYNTAISYIATDLDDVTEGEDLWQYTYTVTGNGFAQGTGFTVEFENSLFVLSATQPTAPNSNWEVSTYESPYYLPGEISVYDAYAMVDNASLANQFNLTFVWTGGVEGPGAQFFNVYDQNFQVMQNGMTAPVPVPGTVMLLGSALAALSAVGRRKKN